MLRQSAFCLFIAVGLAGCGASTSESETDSGALPRVSQTAADQQGLQYGGSPGRSVYGNTTKGPLINATVELFALDSFGFPDGTALATAQTDASGDWQITLDTNDALLVRVSGGSYVDEADTNVDSRRIVELTEDQFLESVLLPGESTVAVTAFSQALVEKSRRETGQTNFNEVIAINRSLFSEAYGFDVLSVLPANPLAPTGSDEAIAYAMNVGGVANAINALSIGSNSALPEYTHILAVVEDLVDCRLDGLGIGAQQVVNPALPGYQDLSLQQQILRFRNNNFEVYQGLEPAPINASRCDVIGGLADTVAPQVIGIASSPFFEAVSPEGTTLSDVQREELREQFVASDDRPGELVWSIAIPQQLPIGSTPLAATVKDAWGNQTVVDWQILVADTEPPDIEGLEPISADAQGDFTIVQLQLPDVSDRVSSQDQIVITNDAPDGFPVGQTLIIWTAQDAAGNAATFSQLVTVNSIPPVVIPAPPVVTIDSGSIDFSQFFNDPDQTTLTFSVTGLPADSGFTLDPGTGILSGTPGPADLAAQLIVLIVSATDGQNSVSVQTTLSVTAPNTPPAFAVSQSALLLDEDFSDQILQIDPVEVPPTEVDQQVTYTVVFSDQAAQEAAPFDVEVDADSLLLTLVARPDANGDAAFDVIANDGQSQNAEFVQTVNVSVTPVNDPPQLTGQNEPVLVNVGQPFEFELSSRASDIDDEVLVFTAVQLPAAMTIDSNGQLAGMALPPDAQSFEIPLQLTASDEQNESVEFVLKLHVSDPDSDGDGLTDYREQLLGFDASLVDSDGDGFGDSLESRIDVDAAVTSVFFVSGFGDDNQSGDTPASALATLAEAGVRLAQLEDTQEAIILVEQATEMDGGLVLTGSNRAVLGSVDFNTLQSAPMTRDWVAKATSVSDNDAAALTISDCQQCAILDLRVTGGRGLAVSTSDIRMDRVHVIGARSVDGGALLVDGSQVEGTRLHFALNRAEQGGAVFLGSQSVLEIRDSVFAGNSAGLSGGAVLVSNSQMFASNVLFVSNTSPVAAVVDALGSVVNVANATVAYNQLKSISDTRLFRCRDAGLTTCSDDDAVYLRDSIIAGNRNSGGLTVDLAQTAPDGPGNLVEPGRGAGVLANELSSIEPFAVGFSGIDAAVLNGGSRSALDAGLDSYFSQPDSAFTDVGTVESGVHSVRPWLSVGNYSVNADFADESAPFSLRAVDITLSDGEQTIIGEHRVGVTAIGTDPHSRVIGLGTVPGTAFTMVPAVDLGDGRYRIWISGSFGAAQDQLLVRLDDDPVGVVAVPTCEKLLCSQADLTAVANGNQQLANELVPITPTAQVAPAADTAKGGVRPE